MSSSDAAISIRNVCKTFGTTRAVHDLDLTVPRGSLCGFLGPNGAGKSTTIRMIMSIIYPDSGSVSVLGGNALAQKDRIGYLPEERGVYRKMRVGEFLEYIAQLKGISKTGLQKNIELQLERIQLADVYHKKCEELSKGMQQKVQFLAAIIHQPDLLILDEPFSGLDPVNADLIRQLVDEIHDQGTTIIFSTHVLHQAEQLCDRIFLINKGVKLLDATLEEIRETYDPRTILAEPLNGTVDWQGITGIIAEHPVPDSAAVELEVATDVDPQEVMRALHQRQALRSVQLRRLTLDEVFIRLVEQGSGSDAAELAREELSHV